MLLRCFIITGNKKTETSNGAFSSESVVKVEKGIRRRGHITFSGNARQVGTSDQQINKMPGN